MYEAFYDLKERPFLMTADPDFLYWSERHSMAYTMLRYGVFSRAPLTVVTGDVGSGKTTLVRKLIDDLPDELEVGLVSNLQEGRGELMQWVMLAFDQEFEENSYVGNYRRFQNFVIENYAEGRRTILIFDEAQNMSPTTLEELRMLSNINADKDELLQIVLVGQPELRETLARPDMSQVLQRVAADFHLEGLDPDEVTAYVQHRLSCAGATRDIIPADTCALIHEVTGGIPRLINSLCDLALVYGCSENQPTIKRDFMQTFLASMDRHGIFSKFRRTQRPLRLVRRGTAV